MRSAVYGIFEVDRDPGGQVQPRKGDRAIARRRIPDSLFTYIKNMVPIIFISLIVSAIGWIAAMMEGD